MALLGRGLARGLAWLGLAWLGPGPGWGLAWLCRLGWGLAWLGCAWLGRGLAEAWPG